MDTCVQLEKHRGSYEVQFLLAFKEKSKENLGWAQPGAQHLH